MLKQLLTQYVPQQMQQPLPGTLGLVSQLAKLQFIAFVAALDALGEPQLTRRNLGRYTAFGNPF